MTVGEAGVDLIVENPAVRELPVVEWAFKVVKAIDGTKSWLLTRKIAKFLSEPSLVAAAEAYKMRDKVLQEEQYAQEVGETLLMVLDKVTDMSKPVLLAKAYAAYLTGDIDRYRLLMMAHVIDISALMDLEQFIEARFQEVGNETFWKERLANSGLFVAQTSVTYGGAGTKFYMSPLGNTYSNSAPCGTAYPAVTR
jgi:hypothetical protein